MAKLTKDEKIELIKWSKGKIVGLLDKVNDVFGKKARNIVMRIPFEELVHICVCLYQFAPELEQVYLRDRSIQLSEVLEKQIEVVLRKGMENETKE